MDVEKIGRIKSRMEKEGIDVMILRNPENVLYISEYWPVTGWSVLVFKSTGEATLIVPESELIFTKDSWVKDIRTYPTEKLDKVWNPYEHIEKLLKEIEIPKGSRIGLELSFETIATNNVCGEVSFASTPTFELIKKTLGTEVVDITQMLHELRMVKTEQEIKKLKLANEIAIIGLEAAREALHEGVRESEIAAECEKAIEIEGIGYKGVVRRARGFAFVMSGRNSARAWYPYNISSSRKIKRGDVVLIELNVFADGYWSDLTRTWVVGTPTELQKDVVDAINAAIDNVVKNEKGGMPASEVDKLARSVIEEMGYGRDFPHRLGHGIGVRMHEPPAIHPASTEIVPVGAVHSVEPGIYFMDFGIRVEDDVYVLKNRVVVLSEYDRSL